MAKSVSCTITLGEGSEQHNHDLDYRNSLSHVHSDKGGIIELIDYKSYQEQINELMKPYIDQYNAKQQERYQAAWERYNSGEIKTKPRKANYKPMNYDYYNTHKNDTYFNQYTNKQEPVPMFRSLILGIGDKADRENGFITSEKAKAIFQTMADEWKDNFPDFKLLGATLHEDEEGFYHAHFDYKPLSNKECSQGLQCSISQDFALENMGFKPEQSIINGRDKVPIRFNSFRNRLYFLMEKAMKEQKLRLQYGISSKKEPKKDSSHNQRLQDWQSTQDLVRTMQAQKNAALDILEGDEVSPNKVKEVGKIINELTFLVAKAKKANRIRFSKKKVAIPYAALDQMGGLLEILFEQIILKQKLEIEKLKSEIAELKADEKELQELRDIVNEKSGKYLSELDLRNLQKDLNYWKNVRPKEIKQEHYNLLKQIDKIHNTNYAEMSLNKGKSVKERG